MAAPSKSTFHLVLIMLVLWEGAKSIPKAVALRHAREDAGLTGEVAKAASLVL